MKGKELSNKVLSDSELLSRLQKLDLDDVEGAHAYADKLLVKVLRSLDYKKSIKFYKTIPKWYA